MDLISDLYFETSLGKISSKELWNRLGSVKGYPAIEKEYFDTCLKIDPDLNHRGKLISSLKKLVRILKEK